MTERQGVEIDYCPKCRGVWLDRGELDKIIERSVAVPNTAPVTPPLANAQPVYGYPPAYADHHDRHDQHGKHGPYRRKSWLGELFD
jgi:Zn-finger nucleic acid-binding protein